MTEELKEKCSDELIHTTFMANGLLLPCLRCNTLPIVTKAPMSSFVSHRCDDGVIYNMSHMDDLKLLVTLWNDIQEAKND